MMNNPEGAKELLALATDTQDAQGFVRVDPAVLTKAAELLTQSASKDLSVIQAERDELGWTVMRMSVALRLIHFYAMSGLMLPESGQVRDWLKRWIDAGMVDQLGWPIALPGTCALLEQWGFQNVLGTIGRVLPTDKPKVTVQ